MEPSKKAKGIEILGEQVQLKKLILRIGAA